MSEQKKRGGSCVLILFILLFFAAGTGIYLYNWYNSSIYDEISTDNSENVELIVSEGETLIGIIPELKEKGLLKSEEAFRIYLRLNNVSANIKAGEYSIPLNINAIRLIEILETGSVKKTILVTLREGLWNEQMAEILDTAFNEFPDEKKFDKAEFVQIAENPDSYVFETETQDFLTKYKPAGKSLIGFLFPDTYNFFAKASSLEVVHTLIQTLQSKIMENNLEINEFATHNNFSSFYHALTLASIIEKESGGTDDKPSISSVFHNRIENEWFLQSDATLGFVLKNNNPRLSFEELETDSPYNSYKYPGLPPTPICNPGILALDAALNPKSTNNFFFRHDTSGNVYFFETYEQHLQSIQDNP